MTEDKATRSRGGGGGAEEEEEEPRRKGQEEKQKAKNGKIKKVKISDENPAKAI